MGARRTAATPVVHEAEAALSVLAGLRRLTLQRGLLGAERRFLLLGAVVWGLHALRKATERQGGVLWEGVVAEGEDLLLTYHPPARRGRRGRRR